MTGLFNVGFNKKGSAHITGVDGRITFLSECLQRAGYRTAGFGKWHLGSSDGSHPLDRGFDRWVGFYGGDMPYHYSSGHSHVFDGKAVYQERWKHSTDLFADQAIEFIRASRNEPFFVYLAFNAVHTPLWTKSNRTYSARSDWVEKVRRRGVINPMAVDYYAVLEHLDDRVGSVLDVLDSLGLREQTLVIYVSDNGAITPDHYPHYLQMGDNGPYRGGKASPYEGGVRVPFVASWTGVIPPGTTSDQPSVEADIMPTILEASGIARPEMNGPRKLNGHSLLGLMKAPDEVALPARGTFSWLGGLFAYVEYPWKLLSVDTKIGLPDAKGMDVTDGRLLFNLETDPGETTEVSQLNQERAQAMWERYQALFDSLRKPLRD
jgi:arylsulfatase A-like enzyme